MKIIFLLFTLFTLNVNAQPNSYLGLSYDEVVFNYLTNNNQWFSTNRYESDTLVVTLHQQDSRNNNLFYFVENKCIKRVEVCIDKKEIVYDGKLYTSYIVCGINTDYIDGDEIVSTSHDFNVNNKKTTKIKYKTLLKTEYYNFTQD